jgi:hypothetical protein
MTTEEFNNKIDARTAEQNARRYYEEKKLEELQKKIWG